MIERLMVGGDKGILGGAMIALLHCADYTTLTASLATNQRSPGHGSSHNYVPL